MVIRKILEGLNRYDDIKEIIKTITSGNTVDRMNIEAKIAYYNNLILDHYNALNPYSKMDFILSFYETINPSFYSFLLTSYKEMTDDKKKQFCEDISKNGFYIRVSKGDEEKVLEQLIRFYLKEVVK